MSRVVNSRMETGGTDGREEDLKNDRKQKDGALPIWEGTVFFISGALTATSASIRKTMEKPVTGLHPSYPSALFSVFSAAIFRSILLYTMLTAKQIRPQIRKLNARVRECS